MITKLRRQALAGLDQPAVQIYQQALTDAPNLKATFRKYNEPVVQIGRDEELSPSQSSQLHQALQTFCPWKKGPFSLFGIEIDSEWRSDLKWDRILPHITSLGGRKVADIGCHNGYYMYRMLAEDPELVVGFEPVLKHYLAFSLLQRYAQEPKLQFEPLGVEVIDQGYPEYFDTIFLLGILYHHTDPVGMLRKLKSSITKNGELIIDCQGIPGSDPVALVPQGRYAGATGIWFLPTVSCLENWLKRAGFRDISCFYSEPLTVAEQRRSPWADIRSLEDFLTADKMNTIEGYPAPWRHYLRAIK